MLLLHSVNLCRSVCADSMYQAIFPPCPSNGLYNRDQAALEPMATMSEVHILVRYEVYTWELTGMSGGSSSLNLADHCVVATPVHVTRV